MSTYVEELIPSDDAQKDDKTPEKNFESEECNTVSEKKVSLPTDSPTKKSPTKGSEKKLNHEGGSPQRRGTRKDRDSDTNYTGTVDTHRGSRSTTQQYNIDIEYGYTYKMVPDVVFSSYEITKLIAKVLETGLAEATGQYDVDGCNELCQNLAGRILHAVKEYDIERYKYVAVVSLGGMEEHPGIEASSRCLWDAETDNYATVSIQNETFLAYATVYAMYQE